MREMLGKVPGIRLLPSTDYLTLAHLMRGSWLILTNSTGIQDEWTMARVKDPFGDGHAAQRIADLVLEGKCQEFPTGARP
jgi:UDP-N-acetylglucosamine 2-epimerase